MASAEIVRLEPTPPPPIKIVLTLSVPEARFLAALLGAIHNDERVTICKRSMRRGGVASLPRCGDENIYRTLNDILSKEGL